MKTGYCWIEWDGDESFSGDGIDVIALIDPPKGYVASPR